MQRTLEQSKQYISHAQAIPKMMPMIHARSIKASILDDLLLRFRWPARTLPPPLRIFVSSFLGTWAGVVHRDRKISRLLVCRNVGSLA
jgi:hypothetical protein